MQLFWAQWGGLHFVRLCPWLLLPQHPAHAWESVSSFWEDLPFGLPRWAVVEKKSKVCSSKVGFEDDLIYSLQFLGNPVLAQCVLLQGFEPLSLQVTLTFMSWNMWIPSSLKARCSHAKPYRQPCTFSECALLSVSRFSSQLRCVLMKVLPPPKWPLEPL